MSDYVIGELVRVDVTFSNGAGTPADPGGVHFDYKNPEGLLTALVYPTHPALVKDSTGIYHVDINANQAGVWKWYYSATGAGQTASRGCFTVQDQWGECE